MLSDQKRLTNLKKEGKQIVSLHKHCIYMHLASIDIEEITFEISKEMEKHNLFRNMHTIFIATSPECLMLITQK